MANEEQLAILRQGVYHWNKWREENPETIINLRQANLEKLDLVGADMREALLSGANLNSTTLNQALFGQADLSSATLTNADLSNADLSGAFLGHAKLDGANLTNVYITRTNLSGANLTGSNFSNAEVGSTIFGNSDLSQVIGLDSVIHHRPSSIATDIFVLSKGMIPETFLRGCGLSDWEIQETKLYSPDISNEDVTNIQYKIYDLRATQALQVSPLFISYSHDDSPFVNKLESQLNAIGVRFWRDIHDMKAGRMEKQIDRAIRQNPTVLLVLSEHSLSSDWVKHEVRTARLLEKDIGRDVLCPVALDDSWKSSRWPARIMEQIMEYNILDFSKWEDDVKFEEMFRKLIDGLELFYKG